MSHLVGQKAPEFTVNGVSPSGAFQEYCLADLVAKKQYTVLFFYPLDFTFVCPLELIQMSQLYHEFKKIGAEVLGISVDSEHSHLAWRNLPQSQGGIGALNFPLLSDVDREIMTQYDVVHDGSPRVALRATTIIDPAGVVRVHQINDLPIGRNPNEILRLVKALQFHEAHGDVCPPNWEEGQRGLTPTPAGIREFVAQEAAS